MISWRHLLAWLPGIPIAIANGIVRNGVYSGFLKELHAHQLSAVSFILLFGAYVFLVMPWLRPRSLRQALGIGLVWLALTVAFEFLFGRYVIGHTWAHLLHDYDMAAGRIWVVVLIWIAVAPMVMHRVRPSR